MRCGLYVRVSTGRQEIQNQLLQLREYCKKNNYKIFEEYIDVISGKETSRPSYDKMFQDAHKRLFDLVLFWDISRFSRAGTLFTLQKLKELENLGIDWESYQEPYFKSVGQFKDVVLSIISTVAKIEREKISQRTKAGLQASKKRHLVGKRGRDKRPRKMRKDRGLKRGHKKPYIESSQNQINKNHR
ncbi:MAG: recombinase family protein [Nanoarchaeota archaeon]|nr:recombinase family protein [Nanoarchaeota archaeon]